MLEMRYTDPKNGEPICVSQATQRIYVFPIHLTLMNQTMLSDELELWKANFNGNL